MWRCGTPSGECVKEGGCVWHMEARWVRTSLRVDLGYVVDCLPRVRAAGDTEGGREVELLNKFAAEEVKLDHTEVTDGGGSDGEGELRSHALGGEEALREGVVDGAEALFAIGVDPGSGDRARGGLTERAGDWAMGLRVIAIDVEINLASVDIPNLEGKELNIVDVRRQGAQIPISGCCELRNSIGC